MWGKWPLKKEAVVPNFKAKKAFAQGRTDDSLFRSWVALLLYVCVYIYVHIQLTYFLLGKD